MPQIATTTTVEQINIEDIDVSHNPRSDLGDLTDLTESIRQHGIVEPIVVRDNRASIDPEFDTDARPYELLMGGRRLAAAAAAGHSSVPAIIRAVNDDAEADVLRLVENIQRADLPPLDEAAAFQRLTVQHGMKQASIAAAIGRNQGYVSKRLSLLKLNPRGRARVATGKLTLEQAVDLAKLPAGLQDDVLDRVDSNSMPFEAVIARTRDRIALLAERAKLVKSLPPGTPVIDRLVDSGPIPEDARKIWPADDTEVAAWAADPNRLAVIRREPVYGTPAGNRWMEYYTTSPEPDRATTVSDEQVTGEDQGPGPATSQAEHAAPVVDKVTQTRRARHAELVEAILAIISGKPNPTWEAFLNRMAVYDALFGGYDAGLESHQIAAITARLNIPGDENPDAEGIRGAFGLILGLLTNASSNSEWRSIALASRLLLGIDSLRYPMQMIDNLGIDNLGQAIAGETLHFLQSQGVQLTDAEQRVVDYAPDSLLTHALEAAVLTQAGVGDIQDALDHYALGEPEEPAVIDAPLPEPATATTEPVADGGYQDADPEPIDGEGDADVDGDGGGGGINVDQILGSVETMRRPELLELCQQLQINTTPKTTKLQLVGYIRDRLSDPAYTIA